MLAEAPFRDLRSRAMLEGIPKRFAATGPVLITSGGDACPVGFEPVPAVPSASALQARRVVIAGVFSSRIQLERALYVAGQAQAAGAALETHCLSIMDDAARPEPPTGIAVLDTLPAVEVREYRTADVLLMWRVAAPVRITPYPEKDIEPDAAFGAELPAGPLLGLGILGGADVQRDIAAHGEALKTLFAEARDWPVVALAAEGPGAPTYEMRGTQHFARAVLPDARWLARADGRAVLDDITPARLKALVATCAMVVTNQDTIAAFAIASGVPVLGIKLGSDRRIATCMSTLANELPPGSELIVGPRYVQPTD
ncbi:hypothetical protein DFH01_23955 [Falsiroseomonas bella]|uniref:Uncharacterized protein n=1 Tax=Falsiroseomonas bella TaxID=2184016 RepID=A0A317F7Z5_9PROT|nr:hypothetical protein [Falsiroseomonas bella]PWS34592.1 hypothetical protein DFH01_23955 [Falsiroseomonas bella]